MQKKERGKKFDRARSVSDGEQRSQNVSREIDIAKDHRYELHLVTCTQLLAGLCMSTAHCADQKMKMGKKKNMLFAKCKCKDMKFDM